MKRESAGNRFKRILRGAFPMGCFVLLVASAAYASGGGGDEGHGVMVDYAWRMLNFAVLAFILYKLTWKKIKEFFSGRRDGIQTALEEAVKAKEEAEKKYREYTERLEKATGEIEGISAMIKAQGATEKEKLIESARNTAEKMKEDSQARMDQEIKKAGSQLRLEAAQLAVQMAEDMLTRTIKKEDHEKMVKDSLDRMVKLN
jgi:F-type H+-transporting ATPase subunit b